MSDIENTINTAPPPSAAVCADAAAWIAKLHSGDRTPQVVLIVHPVPAFAEAVTSRLQRDGLFAGSLLLKPPAAGR